MASAQRRVARNRRRRPRPSRMRSSDDAYENRRYPSALVPKAAPGVTATWLDSRSSRASLTERSDAGPLHELVRRDEEVAIEPLQRADVLARGDHPAEPPTRHGVGL